MGILRTEGHLPDPFRFSLRGGRDVSCAQRSWRSFLMGKDQVTVLEDEF